MAATTIIQKTGTSATAVSQKIVSGYDRIVQKLASGEAVFCSAILSCSNSLSCGDGGNAVGAPISLKSVSGWTQVSGH
jgi:hypothetical protein